MRLLLDTHVALWWATDDKRLTAKPRRMIGHAERVYVSAASAWEVAIKIGIGRLRMRLRAPFATLMTDSGFEALDVTFEHAAETASLPPLHADPFDRMLIAQARVESLTFVSHDRPLQAYQITAIWV